MYMFQNTIYQYTRNIFLIDKKLGIKFVWNIQNPKINSSSSSSSSSSMVLQPMSDLNSSFFLFHVSYYPQWQCRNQSHSINSSILWYTNWSFALHPPYHGSLEYLPIIHLSILHCLIVPSREIIFRQRLEENLDKLPGPLGQGLWRWASSSLTGRKNHVTLRDTAPNIRNHNNYRVFVILYLHTHTHKHRFIK